MPAIPPCCQTMTLALLSTLPNSQTAAGNTAVRADRELNEFLKDVERRAFKMAEFAVKQREDALEIVQDAMFGFVRSYAAKPNAEWRPLFFRVLDSRIQDHFRRRSVRARVFAWLRPRAWDEEEAGMDPGIDRYHDIHAELPLDRLTHEQAGVALNCAVGELPLRQRQAFLYRIWEGFDVAQTAGVMGCSEGSVKTHLFRAMSALRVALENHQ